MPSSPLASSLGALSLSLALGGASLAATAEGSAAKLADVFAQFCVETGPDLARGEAIAGGLHLTPTSPAPGAATAGFTTRVWTIAEGLDKPAKLAFSAGQNDKEAVTTCALNAPEAAADPVKTALAARLALASPLRTLETKGQSSTIWRFDGKSGPVAVIATTPVDGHGVFLIVSRVTKR